MFDFLSTISNKKLYTQFPLKAAPNKGKIQRKIKTKEYHKGNTSLYNDHLKSRPKSRFVAYLYTD